MPKLKSEVVIPALLVAVGIGWLMASLGILPGVDWAWSIGLGAAGVLWLACGGINKGTIVIGPFLLIASALSVVRQTEQMKLEVEVPCLVIALGALLLVSTLSNLPSGLEDKKKEDGQ